MGPTDACCRCEGACDGSLMRTDPRYTRVRDMLRAPEVPRRKSAPRFPGADNIALCHTCQRWVYWRGGLVDLLVKDVLQTARAINARSKSDKPSCPKCGTLEPYFLSTRKTYKCRNRECYHQYSLRSFTDLRANKISPETQDALLKDAAETRLSAVKLAEKHGVTQKTAWNYMQKIGRSAKLTQAEREEIKAFRKKVKQRVLAEKFGISVSQVSAIQRGARK